MCLNPSKISDLGFVACRNCWQCLETKVDDWVGRNIAESKTAKAAHVVTLTYGQDRTTGDIDNIRAAVLTYSDVQKYIKHLRADDYPVRYFVVGEYGSLKGRAHWHIILYWQGKIPEHKIRENFMQKHWPHGWSYWDKSSPEAVRYACKYLLKDPADEEKQGWGPMPSKDPPLGDAYFKQLAMQYVEQQLSPQDLFYKYPDVKRVNMAVRAKTLSQYEQKARPIRFRMHGKTADNFLDYFIEQYGVKWGDAPPRSELVWKHYDKRLRQYLDWTSEIETMEHDPNHDDLQRGKALAEHLAKYDPPRFEVRAYGVKPIAPPPGGSTMQFSEIGNCFFCDDAGPQRLWYSKNSEGEPVWHEKIAPKAEEEDMPVFLKNEYQAIKGYKPHRGETPRNFGPSGSK